MVKCFMCQFGKCSDVFVDVFVLHPQFVEFHCGMVGFICIDPRLEEFFFKVFIDPFVWSGRSGNGQDPILCASFPFVDTWSIHISEGMGKFLPRVRHDRMCGIYKLVEA